MKFTKLFKLQWKYMRDDKWRIVLIIITTSLSAFLGIMYGILIGFISDQMIAKNLKLAIIYTFIFLICSIVLKMILNKGIEKLYIVVEDNMIRKLTLEIYNKTLRLPAIAFEELKTGQIINRVTSDTQMITTLLRRITESFIHLITTFGLLIYIFMSTWIIGVIISIYLIIVFIIDRLMAPELKKRNEKITKQYDEYIAEVSQNVTGIREIKVLGIKDNIFKRMKNLVNSSFKNKKSANIYDLDFKYTIELIDVFYEAIIYAVFAVLVINGTARMGQFLAMTWYIYRFMFMVANYSDLSRSYQSVSVSMKRVLEITENTLYKDEQFGNVTLKQISGTIEFKDVDFAYDGKNYMLSDFNMSIPTNKKIAIIGRSGQGKSTLFNLLLRLFDVNKGEILIDNVNIQDLTEADLRKHIAIIRQEPYLFNKSFYENFKIIDPSVTLKTVRNYCKKAYIDDYIMSLKKGYNTIIGEGGVNLSGGQKQRLAIARALMKNSKIILFDEATSALDNESQEYIKKTINELSSTHTIVIIAHRLTTIKDADKIFVVDSGKVVANGTHEYLIKNDKTYKKLYKSEEITK